MTALAALAALAKKTKIFKKIMLFLKKSPLFHQKPSRNHNILIP